MVVHHLGHSQGLVFRPTVNFSVNDPLTDRICNHVMEHIELCCNLCDTDQQIDLHRQLECMQSTMRLTFMKSKSIEMDRLDCRKIECLEKKMHMKLKF